MQVGRVLGAGGCRILLTILSQVPIFTPHAGLIFCLNPGPLDPIARILPLDQCPRNG